MFVKTLKSLIAARLDQFAKLVREQAGHVSFDLLARYCASVFGEDTIGVGKNGSESAARVRQTFADIQGASVTFVASPNPGEIEEAEFKRISLLSGKPGSGYGCGGPGVFVLRVRHFDVGATAAMGRVFIVFAATVPCHFDFRRLTVAVAFFVGSV